MARKSTSKRATSPQAGSQPAPSEADKAPAPAAAETTQAAAPDAAQPKRGPGRPPGSGKDKKPAASNGPSPDRINFYLARFTTLKTEAARVAQEIKADLDRFKGEGGDPGTLKYLHKSLKLDPREAQAGLERLVRYHAGAGIKVSWHDDGQSSMDDVLEVKQPAPNTEGTRDLAKARAHGDGYNAGLSGAVPSDNPFRHAPGSEEYVAWHDGRDQGAEDLSKRKPGQSSRVQQARGADASLPSDTVNPPHMPF